MTDTPPDTPPAGEGGRKRSSALDRKVGPLTVRAWLVVAPVGVGIGLLAARRLRSDPGDPPRSTAGDPYGQDAGGAPLVPDVSGGITGGTGYSDTPATPPPGPPPPITDNLEWLRRATNYLLARGFDPVDIDTALRLYIGSQPMTEQHAALVGLALAAIGPPPDYVDPVTISPGAVPAPPEPTPAPPSSPAPPPSSAPVVPATPTPGFEVGPGTTGSERLRQVQFIFKASDHPAVNVTGSWDGATATAARAWQRFFGRTETNGLTSYEVDAILGMWAARHPA